MRRPWVGVDRARWFQLSAAGLGWGAGGLILGAIGISSIPRFSLRSLPPWIFDLVDASLLSIPALLASGGAVLRKGLEEGRIRLASFFQLCAFVGFAMAVLFAAGSWARQRSGLDIPTLQLYGFALFGLAWTGWWAYDVVRRERDLTHAETHEVDSNNPDTLWDRLGGEEGAAAEERLAELGSRAVDFVVPRLHPASDDPEWIGTLIRDLDRPDKRIWEAAAAELQGLGRLAEGALRAATFETPEGGFRRDKMLRGEPYPETFRRLRALAVLKRTGHPEALRALEILARGAPEAPFTQAAMTALRPDALAR